MKLFVCKQEIDYEGFNIMGIYDSKEKAENRIKTIKKNEDEYFKADGYSTEEFTLNEDCK